MTRFQTLLEAAGIQEPIRGARKTRTSTRTIDLSDTAGPYAMWLEPPQLSVDVNTAPANLLVERLGLSPTAAANIVSERRRRRFDGLASLDRIRGCQRAHGAGRGGASLLVEIPIRTSLRSPLPRALISCRTGLSR